MNVKLKWGVIFIVSTLILVLFISWNANTVKASTKIAPSQVFFNNQDTTYFIDKLLDLEGGKLVIPKSCTLSFAGGKIINGIVVFNNTKLVNPHFENCRFKGSVNGSEFNIQDYGAKPGSDIDCSVIINDIVKLATSPGSSNNPKHIYLPQGTYYIDHPIELFAGFESPVTLYGDGNMSTICQRHDNDYIIKVFEQNHVKDLRLTYKNKQELKNSKSIAIACQRSIYSLFENLTICKAHTAFGYIMISDQKNGYNPTGYKDQCYVSDNFLNIRVHECSGYALDFKKEVPQGDSGSAYDNIYISSDQWLGGRSSGKSQGAIRGDNTMAAFTQLNIEGRDYTSTLIVLGGFSRMSIQSLHIEGIQNIPTIVQSNVQSMLSTDIIDIQYCKFSTDGYNMFVALDNGRIDLRALCMRPDCTFEKNKTYKLYNQKSQNDNSITIANIIDGTHTMDK